MYLYNIDTVVLMKLTKSKKKVLSILFLVSTIVALIIVVIWVIGLLDILFKAQEELEIQKELDQQKLVDQQKRIADQERSTDVNNEYSYYVNLINSDDAKMAGLYSNWVNTYNDAIGMKCEPCFSYFQYIDYSDRTLTLKNGAQQIKLIESLTSQNIWPTQHSLIRQPGEEIKHSKIGTTESVSITYKYIVISSGLTHIDGATIKNDGLTKLEVQQIGNVINNYASEYKIVNSHISNFKKFVNDNELELKKLGIISYELRTTLDDLDIKLQNNIDKMKTNTQSLINSYQEQQDAYQEQQAELDNLFKILLGLII